MVKLNSNQRRALAAVIPLDGTSGVIAAMKADDFDRRCLSFNQLLAYLAELDDMGLVSSEYTDGEADLRIRLSSAGACYFRDSKIEAAKALGKYLFQLLVGASGGAEALGLQLLLGQQAG